jgi:hypothetical protein
VFRHAEQPRDWVRRQGPLADEFAERFLDDILGIRAPLPGEKNEAAAVTIDQFSKQGRVHSVD